MESRVINSTNQSCKTERWFRLAGNLAALLIIVGIAYPQERGIDPRTTTTETGEPQGNSKASGKRRRLETVTWNPTTCELTWVISEGERSAGSYLPVTRATYVIHMDSAIMQFDGEGRRFSQDEAENVHALMNILSEYAVESTIWWDMGQGEKLDEQKNITPSNKDDNKAPDPAKFRVRPASVAAPHDD